MKSTRAHESQTTEANRQSSTTERLRGTLLTHPPATLALSLRAKRGRDRETCYFRQFILLFVSFDLSRHPGPIMCKLYSYPGHALCFGWD